jgi:hypothetical protein
MNIAVEVLKAARDRITEPEHWTVGYNATNKYGQSVGYNSPEAVSFCALGAILRELDYVEIDVTDTVLESLEDIAHKWFSLPSIQRVNDLLGHEAILRVYDEAIKRLEPAENASDINWDNIVREEVVDDTMKVVGQAKEKELVLV